MWLGQHDWDKTLVKVMMMIDDNRNPRIEAVLDSHVSKLALWGYPLLVIHQTLTLCFSIGNFNSGLNDIFHRIMQI